MSFRHTYITEFLYKFGKEEEIEKSETRSKNTERQNGKEEEKD